MIVVRKDAELGEYSEIELEEHLLGWTENDGLVSKVVTRVQGAERESLYFSKSNVE